MRWEEHVDVVWINNGREVLIAVGHGGVPHLKLPSVDLENLSVRVGGGGGDLPDDVTTIAVRVRREPVESSSIGRARGVRGSKSKAEGDIRLVGLTVEDSTDNAHAEMIGRPTRSQAKQARDLIAIHLRRLVGQDN